MKKIVSIVWALPFCAMPVAAETITLSTTLAGSAEVPPANGSAQGSGEFKYDTETNQLTYFVRYSGLTGPVIRADLHGPAGPKVIGPVVIHFISADSPISGTKTLSQSQSSALLDGQLYVELDTKAYGLGEIRGQIHR